MPRPALMLLPATLLLLHANTSSSFVAPPSSSSTSSSSSLLAVSSSSSSFSPQQLPLVLSLDMVPGSIKAGGLMTYLRLLALGQQRGDHPYTTMPSADGLTCIFADPRPGAEPAGAISIQLQRDDDEPELYTGLVAERLDPARSQPYPGEATVMLHLCSALVDLADDPNITLSDSLFQLTEESRKVVGDVVVHGGVTPSAKEAMNSSGLGLLLPNGLDSLDLVSTRMYAWLQETASSFGFAEEKEPEDMPEAQSGGSGGGGSRGSP